MKNTIVSIIIPTYNRSKYLPKAIESCLRQSYTDIEVIVCDDHSTDNTKDIISDFAHKDNRVIYLPSEIGEKGPQRARYNGICHSRGDFIAFLDSSDELTENSIESRLNSFEKEPNLTMVYGNAVNKAYGKMKSYIYYPDLKGFSNKQIKDYLLHELSLCDFPTMMVKKSFFENNPNAMNLDLPAWQDDDLVMSIVFQNGQILNCGEFVLKTAPVTGDNISSNYEKQYHGLLIIYNQYKKLILHELGIKRLLVWRIRLFLNYLKMKQQRMAKSRRLLFFPLISMFDFAHRKIYRIIAPKFYHYYV